MTLNVLVLESERGAADGAVTELEAAGHRVVRCHDRGAPAFPCKALANDPACPLRTGVVDVALTVRPRPRSQPAPQEDGVACALEHHVPLVVAGSALLNPYAGFATEVLDRTDGIVEACEHAAAAALPKHGKGATEAFHRVLAVHGTVARGHVDVYRREGRLLAIVRCDVPLDHTVKSIASVRIVGTLRELDADAAGIDVVFDH
jgi:hypothetical protein